jgi:hypothetical protein
MRDHLKMLAEFGRACEAVMDARSAYHKDPVNGWVLYEAAVERRMMAEMALTDVLEELEAEIES